MATSPDRITVITVNYNMADQLAVTIDSVLSQNYPDLEYVVIDGGSTDGSQNVITRASARLSRWVSEPDQGLYDAMNKGARAASGDWVIFMNSGDVFTGPDIIAQIFAESQEDADLVYGHYIRRYPMEGIDRLVRAEPPAVLPMRMNCSHQSLFTRRRLLLERPFATDLLAADYDFILNAYLNGKRFVLADRIIGIATTGGRSDTHRLTSLRQRITIVRAAGLMTMGLALRYGLMIVRAVLAQVVRKVLPRGLVAAILRHRPIRGMG